MTRDKVNILLVDDQPAKLLSYEVILRELGEYLIKASSAREALEHLLKKEIAVVLTDVCMPEIDGFQLATMIREHPRFQKTAIIFVSAINLADADRLCGYEMGAVDYVTVPVIPELLRAKVQVFVELYRKTRQLEKLNHELEALIAERTWELETYGRLLQSEELRKLALAASQMGTWNWDAVRGLFTWDEGQYRIFGVDPGDFALTIESVRALVHPEDWDHLREAWWQVSENTQPLQTQFRVLRPNGELRWCIGSAATSVVNGKVVDISGVTVDITDRKEAEDRQVLLTRKADQRARNALAVVQSIVRLTQASNIDGYVAAVEDRIGALARAHALLSDSRWQGVDFGKLVEETMAPFWTAERDRIVVAGPKVVLEPATAQSLALALYELATNASKYGPLSVPAGWIRLTWEIQSGNLVLDWSEIGGPPVEPPLTKGYGTKFINASIERQLDGAATFDWRRDGLHCTLSVPLGDKLKLAECANGGLRTPLREYSHSSPEQCNDETPGDSVRAGGAEFTTRELDVLASLAKGGKSNKMIARELDMREGTVKVHVRSLLKKLNATNRTQLALRANHALDTALPVNGGRLMIPAEPAADQCSTDTCSRSQETESTPAVNQHGKGTLDRH